MNNNMIAENKIRVERVFDAPVKLLWQAWTEPALIKLWFGSDPNGTVEKVIMDVRIGGTYEISFSNADLAQHTCRGKFISVIENESLVYSWEWESEPGHVSELKVSFYSMEEKTMVILEHTNLNPNSLHAYAEGWNRAFTKIGKVLWQNK